MNPLTRLSLCAVLALSAVALPAQTPQPTPQPTPPPRDAQLLSIDFPGGPLSKLVAELNRGPDTRLSIVQSAGLDPLLPAFSVRNAQVDSVVMALGQLISSEGYLLQPTGPNLAVLTRREGPKVVDPNSRFTVLPLENRLGNRPAATIITAIQAGCEFASEDKSKLRFQYHEATKLLFVSGSTADIDVAHKIFGRLPELPVAETASPASSRK